MFTEIDHILFPDKCEVLCIGPDYFYPIFKNGSSSLRQYAEIKEYRTLINQQIAKCEIINVFLRDPRKRLISGTHTFVEHLRTDNSDLDEQTILWFLQNYLFLDRHLLPQFFWLINLSRYCDSKCELKFHDINAMNDVIGFQSNKTELLNPLAVRILESKNLDAYLRLEDHLMAFIGKSVTMKEILSVVKLKDKHLYDHVFSKIKAMNDVLS